MKILYFFLCNCFSSLRSALVDVCKNKKTDEIVSEFTNKFILNEAEKRKERLKKQNKKIVVAFLYFFARFVGVKFILALFSIVCILV